MPYLTREMVQANRDALDQALAAGKFRTNVASDGGIDAWLAMQGHGFSGKAQLTLCHEVWKELGRTFERFYLNTIEGDDDEYEQFRYAWSKDPADAGDARILRHNRSDIVALFCPEGDAGWSETVLLLDRVRDALKAVADALPAGKRVA